MWAQGKWFPSRTQTQVIESLYETIDDSPPYSIQTVFALSRGLSVGTKASKRASLVVLLGASGAWDSMCARVKTSYGPMVMVPLIRISSMVMPVQVKDARPAATRVRAQ